MATAALVLATGMAGLVVGGPQAGAANPFSAPKPLGTYGGTGRAGVYAWGVAYNPVTNDVWVGDYVNARVRRFSVDGARLTDPTQKLTDRAAAVAVNETTGDVYVSNSGRIYRFDKNGLAIRNWDSKLGFSSFLDVASDGRVWHVRRTGGMELIAFTNTGNISKQFTVTVPGGMTGFVNNGLAVTGSGTSTVLWVLDTTNKYVHKINQDGAYLGGWGNTGGFLQGDLRGITVDSSTGFVYITDAAGNQVEKYDLNGNHLATFGGFVAPRQVDKGADGTIWVAEYGAGRFTHLTSSGTVLGTYPDPAQTLEAPALAFNDDVAVDSVTGNIWTTDQYNQRVVAFAPNGSVVRSFGERGGEGPFGTNYPRAIAVDSAARRVWVGNHEAGQIKIYNADTGAYITSYGDNAGIHTERDYFGITDIDIVGDRVYLTFMKQQYMIVLNRLTGEEIDYHQFTTNDNGWNERLGVAVDPVNLDVYIAQAETDRVEVWNSNWQMVRSFGAPGTGPGKYKDPYEVLLVGPDELWVTDTTQSRVDAWTKSGTFLGSFGGLGSGPLQFRNPRSMAIDAAGKVYITDVENDRIVIVDSKVPKPAYSFAKPTVTISSPANGSTVVVAPVALAGSFSAAKGVFGVSVKVQDTATNLWWNGNSATWVATAFENLAPAVALPGATSGTWSYKLPGGGWGGTYRFDVTSKDIFNTLSAVASTTVTLSKPSADAAPPALTIANPTAGSTQTIGATQITGTATDDVRVAKVEVAVQKQGTGGGWLTSAGTYTGASFVYLPVTLNTPGTASSTFTFAYNPPSAGTYGIMARVTDGANKTATVQLFTFTVANAVLDSAPPETTLTPFPGNTTTANPVVLSGTATDDLSVETVRVGIRDRTTLTWLQADGTWKTTFAWRPATLANPKTPSTTWTYSFPDTGSGSYAAQVVAVDSAGKVDPTNVWYLFTA